MAGAVGRPSAALERAAIIERNNVLKDSRRLVVIVGIMLVLLATSGFAANAFLQ